MPTASPSGRRIVLTGLAIVLIGSMLTWLSGALLDGWAWHSLLNREADRFSSHQALRSLGYAPVWLAVCVAITLIDSARARNGSPGQGPATWSRGPFILASACLAGFLAEVCKLFIHRARPVDSGGAYKTLEFFARGLNTSDYGLPSSHAAVAFGAAFALSKLHPRAAPVFVLAALGCGFTRVVVGEHYVSDVVGGAVIGLLVPVMIGMIHARLQPPAA